LKGAQLVVRLPQGLAHLARQGFGQAISFALDETPEALDARASFGKAGARPVFLRPLGAPELFRDTRLRVLVPFGDELSGGGVRDLHGRKLVRGRGPHNREATSWSSSLSKLLVESGPSQLGNVVGGRPSSRAQHRAPARQYHRLCASPKTRSPVLCPLFLVLCSVRRSIPPQIGRQNRQIWTKASENRIKELGTRHVNDPCQRTRSGHFPCTSLYYAGR